MDLKLKDKIVLLTGSTQGIGRATAEVFLQEGARVVLNGRDEMRLDRVTKELGQIYDKNNIFKFCGDMTNKEDITNLKNFIRKKFTEIDVLIPCIGSGKPICENQLEASSWERMLEVNLLSVVNLLDALKTFIAKKGCIVTISSIAAREYSVAPYAYAASKDALIVLTTFLSKELARQEVRVNCVLPGNIFFAGGRWEELLNADFDGVTNMIKRNVPMERFGKPEEVAAAIVFLASEKSSFTTGSTLVIDGGQLNSIK